MTDTPDQALRHALERFLVRGELNRLTDVLKYDPDQPREPAGSPEGGRFAYGGGGRVGRSVVGRAARAVARGVSYVRNSRIVQFAGNALFMRRLNSELRRHDVPASQRAIIAAALVAGGDGVRRQIAQSAASAAALSVAAPASETSISVSIKPRPTPSTSALRESLSYKADDSGSWFVNKHGLVFAVVDDVYYLVDAADIPALVGLTPGDYTHAEIAAAIADAEVHTSL